MADPSARASSVCVLNGHVRYRNYQSVHTSRDGTAAQPHMIGLDVPEGSLVGQCAAKQFA